MVHINSRFIFFLKQINTLSNTTDETIIRLKESKPHKIGKKRIGIPYPCKHKSYTCLGDSRENWRDVHKKPETPDAQSWPNATGINYCISHEKNTAFKDRFETSI